MVTRLLLLALLSGCCSAPVLAPIGLPARPHLEPLDVELQATIPPHALRIIAENDLSLKAYAKRLEARIKAHDETVK